MTKTEIVQILKKKKGMTANELAEKIGISIIAIRKSLQRMLGSLEIERIELTRKEVEEKGIRFSGRHYIWRLKDDEEI